MCGPSSQEKSLQAQSQSFSNVLNSNYQTLFGDQMGVLNGINKSLSPTLAAGPSQMGFNPQLTAALNTQAINTAGATARNLRQSAANFGAGEGGGGTSGLTSGVTRQLQQAGAISAENQLAGAEEGITEKSAELGNQNYWRSLGGEQALAGEYSPNAAMQGATNANQASFGEASQMTTENNALGQDIAGFATAAAGAVGDIAACPVAGSLILMADGSEKPVESLVPGDAIQGIDDEPCIVEEIPSEYAETISITTSNGYVTHNSPTHAFALAKGGFTVSVKSLGKRILTADGVGVVVSIVRKATEKVYNIITDGSHTYRADGVWAFGVGDAERHIPMTTWANIGKALMIDGAEDKNDGN